MMTDVTSFPVNQVTCKHRFYKGYSITGYSWSYDESKLLKVLFLKKVNTIKFQHTPSMLKTSRQRLHIYLGR